MEPSSKREGAEFEYIHHTSSHYHFFLVNMLYRTPHIHSDFEICTLLEGKSIDVTIKNRTYTYHPGDIWPLCPFQSHELKADEPVLLLVLQVSPSFFNTSFPRIANLEFLSDEEGDYRIRNNALYMDFLRLALFYYDKEHARELTVSGRILLFFDEILQSAPYRFVDDKERAAQNVRAQRMRSIITYINDNSDTKLLLSDIAEKEHLSMSYLSHFFKDCFGISFQEYLLRLRCEKARQLLLTTSDHLLDISIACGFSDVKYFTSDFKKQYGHTPKEYRRYFQNAKLDVQQRSMLTTQDFLSERNSPAVLKKVYDSAVKGL